MKKEISWLYKELPKLVQQDIISADTAKLIKEYYGPVTERDWKGIGLTIFSILGTILIGSGIILLLAHNWLQLTRLTRTIIIFLSLISTQIFVGWVIYNDKSSPWKEGSTSFLIFILGAAIALISQTYNLPGDFNNFILVLMLLNLPIIYLAQVTLPAFIYVLGISIWGINLNNTMEVLFIWPLIGLILPYYFKRFKKDLYSNSNLLLLWEVILASIIAISLSLEWSNAGLVTISYSSYFLLIYLLGSLFMNKGEKLLERPLQTIGMLGILIISYIQGFEDVDSIEIFNAAFIDYFLAVLFFATCVFLVVKYYSSFNKLILSLAILPLLVIFTFLIPSLRIFIYNAYLFYLGILIIVYGIKEKKIGKANLGMLIISVQIISRFFFMFEITFLTRALIFIILGLAILASNIFLSKNRGEKNEDQ
ncbi:DUF2157 domain-containing protein [Orenia marismortui]|uniref:Putative membrane protein n=1 Tax=Orenia marismortui TaxID=46469 RepID=A0A4R8GZP9_9FIRM|nr:DUF2157 domain-containing protein [Orenia marismortui]TDX52330.1 putative membrane protein [Orenia marismortui]